MKRKARPRRWREKTRRLRRRLQRREMTAAMMSGGFYEGLVLGGRFVMTMMAGPAIRRPGSQPVAV